MTFGEKLKSLRLKTSLTLTEFCVRHNLDPGNYSRLERGLKLPPRYQALLEDYARIMGLRKGTRAMLEFCDLAYAETGRIPPDLMENEEFAAYLPHLFALVRNNGMKVFNGD